MVTKKAGPGKIRKTRSSTTPKPTPQRGEILSSVEQFRALARQAGDSKYLLRLYVAGTSPKSSRAIENVRRICEEHLSGRYDLEVIDLYKQPVLSKGEQIVAVPTLIKRLPVPLRKFIGDMSNTERILVGLDLQSKTA